MGTGTKFIGRYIPTGWEFSGLIGEVRIYNRALSASEIKALYEQGLALKAG